MTRIKRCKAVGLVIAVGLWASPALAQKDRYDVGESVPVFTLKAVNPDASGENYVSIDKYFGADSKTPKKGVLLSFFATYCEPCKKEMPFLSTLYDVYKDKGLQVLVVSIDKDKEKIEELQQLAQAHDVKFPVLSDRFNIVAKRYFISKLPNVYFLNAEGRVSLVAVGYNDDITKQLLEEARRSVGESVSEPVPDVLAKYLSHSAAPASSGAAVEQEASTPAPMSKGKAKRLKGKRKR